MLGSMAITHILSDAFYHKTKVLHVWHVLVAIMQATAGKRDCDQHSL